MASKVDLFLTPICQFAENILKACIDTYGDPNTPLFVNALDMETYQGAHYDTADVKVDTILSNVATHQHLLRLLVGLTELTGQEKYRKAAEAAVSYMFDEVSDSQGLLFWGGHAAYDLPGHQPVFAGHKGQDNIYKGRVHELKCHYPFYNLMWEVNPDAFKRYVEALWNAHILDWSILDFNRHGEYDKPMGKLWDQAYPESDVFFWGGGLTFINAGSDLFYAAAMLAKFTGDDAPLTWAKRLAHRYVETRQGKIGISGYQFSQCPAWCNGPDIRGDRAQYQYAPYLLDNHLIYEGTLFRPVPQAQRCQLFIGDILGSRGQDFTKWPLEEMTAWGKTAYRKADNSFVPMLTDGYNIEGFVIRREGYFGPKGRIEAAKPATTDFFWMYANGYRISKDSFLWQMTRDIAIGNNLGDIGEPDGKNLNLNPGINNAEYQTLYGFLELHRVTGRDDYLQVAIRVGENLLQANFRDGFFPKNIGREAFNGISHSYAENATAPKLKEIAPVDNPTTLALLHLASTLKEESEKIPTTFK